MMDRLQSGHHRWSLVRALKGNGVEIFSTPLRGLHTGKSLCESHGHTEVKPIAKRHHDASSMAVTHC